MKVVAIIQARMGSTRLPGKVLLDLAGEPMLARVVQRMERAQRVDDVVIATTTEPRDDELELLSAKRGWRCYRGSENDVLDRYYQAALIHRAEVVVRITADCPFIDPAVVDSVVEEFQKSPPVDYASNTRGQRTFPRGLDTEVFSFAALERLWREDRNPTWREHVTTMIQKSPELFRTREVRSVRDWHQLRWTVDTPEDFAFAQRVYEHFDGVCFSWHDVLAVLEENPEWSAINQQITQKTL